MSDSSEVLLELPAYEEGTYEQRNTGAACWSCAGLLTHAPGLTCRYPHSHRADTPA